MKPACDLVEGTAAASARVQLPTPSAHASRQAAQRPPKPCHSAHTSAFALAPLWRSHQLGLAIAAGITTRRGGRSTSGATANPAFACTHGQMYGWKENAAHLPHAAYLRRSQLKAYHQAPPHILLMERKRKQDEKTSRTCPRPRTCTPPGSRLPRPARPVSGARLTNQAHHRFLMKSKRQQERRNTAHLPQAEYLRRSQLRSSTSSLPIVWAVEATATTRPAPPCSNRRQAGTGRRSEGPCNSFLHTQAAGV